MALGGLGIVKRESEAGAIHRLLLDPVDDRGLGDTDELEHGRTDIDAVGELRTDPGIGLDPVRPQAERYTFPSGFFPAPASNVRR